MRYPCHKNTNRSKTLRTDDLFFSGSSENLEYGGALGYRWVSDDLNRGFDLIVYRYDRELADTVEIEGVLLDTGSGNELGEVPQALRVRETDAHPAVLGLPAGSAAPQHGG